MKKRVLVAMFTTMISAGLAMSSVSAAVPPMPAEEGQLELNNHQFSDLAAAPSMPAEEGQTEQDNHQSSGKAAVPSMQAGYLYSKDSDGVYLRSYNVGINNEEDPWSLMYFHNRLSQSGMTISENIWQGKLRGSVGRGYITLWAGDVKSDLRKAGTAALMYDTALGVEDHVWLSYGHDIVDTVLAQQANINTNTAVFSYLHKPSSTVDINVTATHTKYTDNNTQHIYELAVKNQFNKYFSLGLNYDHSNADHAASPVYYVPMNESVLSLKPQFTIPIGPGKLNITAEQALAGHSDGATSRRQSIDAAVVLGKFSVGYIHFNDVGYKSRVSYIKWDTSF